MLEDNDATLYIELQCIDWGPILDTYKTSIETSVFIKLVNSSSSEHAKILSETLC